VALTVVSCTTSIIFFSNEPTFLRIGSVQQAGLENRFGDDLIYDITIFLVPVVSSSAISGSVKTCYVYSGTIIDMEAFVESETTLRDGIMQSVTQNIGSPILVFHALQVESDTTVYFLLCVFLYIISWVGSCLYYECKSM
jgi:hypothetical protein